jgi:hypothetical protein
LIADLKKQLRALVLQYKDDDALQILDKS